MTTLSIPQAPPKVGQVNLALAASLILLHALVLFAMPVLLVTSAWWALAMLPLVALSSAHWGLIHEAIHKVLHEDAQANERLGRLLSVLMGASFHVLRFGHLMHHKLNRDWHSERVQARTWRVRADYYFNLFFGLYLSEFFLSISIALLPRRAFMRLANATILKGYPEVAVAGERFLYVRGNVKPLRVDMACMAVLYGSAFYAYGAAWPWLLAFIGARAMVISFLDNIYHYATPGDNSKAGKELALPTVLSLLILRSNYHETHHLNPDVPWHQLPHTHAAQNRQFDGPWFAHARMQLAGPPVA